ncbi:hypothetical protein ONZ45_g2820 [Pleurotus djamor]|nr:hypothetical protein ONZ45_g2820 [Pleurotus djamor]
MATIKLRVLRLVNEQRSAYGLRYNDFERYRKHCANRTHRLRSSLKTTHGKGREFKKLPVITEDNITDAHLELLLFEAERAWSYAQELLAIINNDPKAKPGLKQTAKGRFRRSLHWATQLLSHCQILYAKGRLPAEGFLEVHIYVLILNGRWLRQRYELEDSLPQLAVAKSLLDELAATAPTSRDQALAVLFSDEISPEIRYCAHELRREKAYDIERIVSEFAPKHKNELVEGCDKIIEQLKQEATAVKGATSSTLKPLIWEGTPVPIRNPELVDVLLKVQEAQARLEGPSQSTGDSDDKGKRKESQASSSKKGVAAYDAILHALSDAEDVARKLVESQQTGTSSSAVSTSRDIHFVHAYIVYQLLSHRIQRDLLLVSSLLASHPPSKKPGSTQPKSNAAPVDSRLYPAVVKLYDTVLQSLGQMRALSIVDDSPDRSAAVDARISFTKARRCLYLAKCYTPLKKYAEALILTQKANIHLREARSALSIIGDDPINNSEPKFYILAESDHVKLETDLAEDVLRFKKEWFAFNGGAASSENTGYKKPLFFDIALNYVQLDMDRLQERAGKAPPKPPTIVAPVPVAAKASEPKKSQAAKVVEEVRPATPEPTQVPRGGLSSLLGGWWGRS